MLKFDILIILTILLSASFITTGTEANHLNNFDNGPYTYLYYSDFSALNLDGKVSPNEYPNSLELLDLGGSFVTELSWGHNNTHMAVALRSKGTGWIGIGLGPEGVSMSGADIVVGYVKSGTVTMEDMYTVSQSKPTKDADSYIKENSTAGSEEKGETILEFIIPLRSNDTKGKDHDWEIGKTYGFFTAFHEKADNFGFKHTSHTSSMSVMVLPDTVASPSSIDMDLSVVPHTENKSVSVSIILTDTTDTLDLSNISIGIYEKSLFGKALIDIITTNSQGLAKKDIGVEDMDKVVIISVIPASTSIKRVEATDDVDFIVDKTLQTEETFGDLRDTFGEHMFRNILLTLFLLVILSLIFAFSGVLLDILAIYREGNKEDQK